VLTNIGGGIPGVSEADFVALMGLHGTGRNDFNNSGFSGLWTAPANIDVINNQFYRTLLGRGTPNVLFTQGNSTDNSATQTVSGLYNPPQP